MFERELGVGEAKTRARLISLGKVLGKAELRVGSFVPVADESTAYVWLREHALAPFAAPQASLMFAVAELVLVWGAMYAMYRRAWFLRIG